MGQVVVITGAGGGLGSVFAVELAKDGKLIAVLDYDMEAAQRVAAKIREQGGTAAAVRCNVVDKNSMEQARREVREKLGKCNVLINCAGISNPKLLTEITTQEWNRMLAVDLTSNYFTCKYAVPVMIKQNFGRIINLASQVGQKGSVEHCHYAAAKAGVIGFTKSLAREVGKYNITANCIAPGPIETQLMGVVSDEWRKNKEAELVLPRFGELEEILPTAVFLAAEPDGNLYTGQTLGPNLGDVMY